MTEDTFQDVEKLLQEKDLKINELEEKLRELQNKLFEFNKDLEKRVIDRTLEVNKLLREKTRFIDNLSHDLGTPLTPIITLLPVIKEGVKDPVVLEMVDTCIRNTEYIKRVVHNTRELAEIGSTSLILRDENINFMVNELIQKYDTIFKSLNIVPINNIDDSFFIKTERNRFLQLLDHLTSNAVNSMIETGGQLTFSSKPVTKDSNNYIQITVTDTGVGLTVEESNHIFDEFYKTDNSRHKLDSTGLGLTICKNIIKKHNGNIWAESHGKGTGTSIHFTIPTTDISQTQSSLYKERF
jgi:signal transduction histidine kinase